MSLVDALTQLGIPDPSSPDELIAFGDDLYVRVEPADLNDPEALAAAARDHAPEFVALAEAACRAEHPQARNLLTAVANVLPQLRNLAFADAADVALQSPHLLKAHARSLAGALAKRVDDTRLGDGLQAYAYLETLTRMGLSEDPARFRALEVLSSVTLDDSSDLLERLPRLVGLAFDQWREDALDALLKRLLEHKMARADALFELAQADLRAALEGGSIEAVMAGIANARDRFAVVESMDEARDDATIYRSALDVLIAFAGSPSGTAGNMSDAIKALSEAIAHRAAFTARAAMGGWAVPRRQAEVEWYGLANTLRAAAGPLGQPSWLTPVDTLSKVLAAYQASRSVTVVSADGIRLVLEPTIEAAFLRREGLLEHLRAALEAADEVSGLDVKAARKLLDAVSSPKHASGGDVPGKVWAAAPALVAELGARADAAMTAQLAQAIEETPAVVAWFNSEAEGRARARTRHADPVVDELLTKVLDGLDNCAGFAGTAREEFVELVSEVLRFAADRADAGRENWGADIAYLFPPRTGESPFTEAFLQKDVYSWLCSSGFRPHTRMEERDVAAGRADVTVTRQHRFVIEVKRELSDASREAVLAAYGGQAAGYALTGPPVSLAMVLDLTDHSRGLPGLEDSVFVDEVTIPGGGPRQVVTVVIRGNRPTPRQIRN